MGRKEVFAVSWQVRIALRKNSTKVLDPGLLTVQAAPEHGIRPSKTVTEGTLPSSAGPGFPELPSFPGGASARGQGKVCG